MAAIWIGPEGSISLYVANDIDTAYREYFGGSFATFSLRGQVEQIFDLRRSTGLRSFAKIIAAFDLTRDT